ncbi:12397_t:CDS:2, partial [Dentiscutata heterogama]
PLRELAAEHMHKKVKLINMPKTTKTSNPIIIGKMYHIFGFVELKKKVSSISIICGGTALLDIN